MIRDDIGYQVHAVALQFGDKTFEILMTADFRIKFVMIDDIVAVTYCPDGLSEREKHNND